jgi:hypothetical protein
MIRKLTLAKFATLFLGVAANANDIKVSRNFSGSVFHNLDQADHCPGYSGINFVGDTGSTARSHVTSLSNYGNSL